MRKDVLYLILGWTLIALTVPLFLCGLATIWLDSLEVALYSFAIPCLISPILGVILLSFTRTNTSERLRDKEAFAAVALVWPLAVFIGALPYWFGGVFIGPFTDNVQFIDIARGVVNSWFESMSGFTTTGATVISPAMSPNCIPGSTIDCINAQPKGLLIWRSLTQWLGGMGIIMLGMMILSRIIGGGMALARAELTGPSLSKIKPKLQQTAITLWSLYIALTIIEFILLKLIGGMTMFDSLNHALTTVASGGFSTHDASIGYFDSIAVESIIIIFMFLAGVNFTLIWLICMKEFKQVSGDEEFRNYLAYLGMGIGAMVIALISTDMALGNSFRYSIFNVISIGTSTGYASTDYIVWPMFTKILFLILMIIGASAGSTSGGLKLLRINLAFKVAMRELVKIAHPRRIQRIRMNGEVVERQQLGLIVGMLFVWIGLFAISCLILAIFMENDSIESIISVVASCLGNTGPALGDYGPSETWAGMNSITLLITSVLMWFGRLELLTAVILLHPSTWAKEEKEQADRTAVALFKKLLPSNKEQKKS
jgi:trk system potassium uptake protein TrkH